MKKEPQVTQINLESYSNSKQLTIHFMYKRRVDLEVLKHFDKVQMMLQFCIREGYILGNSVFGGAWDCGREPEFLEHLQRHLSM